ncbi:low-specificity L-threonine aldolase [Haliea sp. AH-315-K21]|uniref:Low-specificity L-threonine aldolase n=1 Tax=SAR86 cluster bacterium TaxID=2030880 RepID=A0A2A5CBJ9_9GAMM|nr:low-specificity L-threonine aldolase [Haliea sp. AH-315-K21]PCJ41207.1 MAG: low-specificity L-threonine aldolase [SAR86 cluster bacterium]
MIDLRSDTVTKPSQEMREVMAKAEVGDDVWGDDPTVKQLEERAADMLGMEAAIFAASGTQTNLIALMCHCQRGDEYLVGQTAHTYRYEGGGAAVLGSIQPQPINNEADGSIALENILAAIKPDDIHFAKSRLLCLENTTGGKVLPLDYLEAATSLASEHGLVNHLDGARVFNAAVKLGVDVEEIAKYFDSVSICLSKGLGAPVGSVLCGSKTLIKEAHRWRKMLGGGMRQAGIIAAAGIYVLENNIQRLQEDHDHAALLGQELAKIPQLDVDLEYLHTNMVFLKSSEGDFIALSNYLEQRNILIDARYTARLVCHLDVSREDVLTTIAAIKDYYKVSE